MANQTFDICSEFELVRTSRRAAVSTPEGSPVIRARQINERQVRVFGLRWKGAPGQLSKRIDYLWAKTYGNVLNMDWTPPGESAIEVRFAAPSRTTTLEGAASNSEEIELEEVL